MAEQDAVLVAIINNVADFMLVKEQQWYRIPVLSITDRFRKRWPPSWIAFYQTKIFAHEAYAINYYARVADIRRVGRRQLFPRERENQKSNKQYYQIFLHQLQRLPKAIISRRRRRIIFIQTTWRKFINAVEINDLYDESPLEDRLWDEFRRLRINAERQELVQTGNRNYALDFAVYCEHGNIDIETDGDLWHANPQRAREDNIRDNDLKTAGWHTLRFSTNQIREEMTSYCLQTITNNINNLGGIKEDGQMSRNIHLHTGETVYQTDLFDYNFVLK